MFGFICFFIFGFNQASQLIGKSCIRFVLSLSRVSLDVFRPFPQPVSLEISYYEEYV